MNEIYRVDAKSTLLCYNGEELKVILCQKLIMLKDMKVRRQ